MSCPALIPRIIPLSKQRRSHWVYDSRHNRCGSSVNTKRDGCGLLHTTIPGVLFSFSSSFYCTELSSIFGSYYRSFYGAKKKKREIDGLENNDFMNTVMEILEIGTRLLISQVIASQIWVTNAYKLLPSQPSSWHLVKRPIAHIPRYLFFSSFSIQNTK